MSKELAVLAKQLVKAFSGKEIIHNCTMSVEKGSIYGFLGKNGAGKTTVFKILLGFLKPTMGGASIFGMDIVRENLKILRRTGSLIETPVFYDHLSAAQNLQIHLDYMDAGNADIEGTLSLAGLPGTGGQPVSAFSLGMRQRLAIARAIIHQPELLILDEPVNGLDPIGIRDMRELFLRLSREKGMTILLSSHILSEVEQIADQIGVIADGTVIQEISAKEIRDQVPGGIEEYFMKMVDGGVLYA